MYELYDKNGNQIGYRMTKRIKNEDGKYDVFVHVFVLLRAVRFLDIKVIPVVSIVF